MWDLEGAGAVGISGGSGVGGLGEGEAHKGRMKG